MLDVLLILFLSFVPMFIYAMILWWLDRYEKEPLPLLVATFVWGAIPSIILALIFEVVLDIPVVAVSPNQLTYDLLGASVIAPVVEEGVKALAIIALLLLFRREIDSPMDGLIYGGIVGFGFAAVENVFYLAGAYSEGGIGGVLGLAFLRAGLFGLNHAMYTSFTGLGVAISLEVRNKLLKPVSVLLGFILAVGTHAFHNALATFTGYSGNLLTFLIAIIGDWGGVLLLLLVALGAFFLERRRITAYGQALVAAHTIPGVEVEILKSVFLRNIACLKRLFTGDIKGWWQMGRYYQRVTEAAFAWHRLNHGDPKAQKRLTQLEQEFQRLRQGLVSSNTMAVQ